MPVLDPKYPFSELSRDVIAGFYRSFDSFGFGFLEPVQASPRGRAKARGPKIQTEVAFELFHLGEPVGRYRADLIVEEQLIVEIKTGTALDPSAIAQLLNYLNVTKLPLGLVLFFGPKPKVKRIIRDDTREYPVIER